VGASRCGLVSCWLTRSVTITVTLRCVTSSWNDPFHLFGLTFYLSMLRPLR